MAKIILIPGGKNKTGAYANQTVILPVVGEVTFNADGHLEVDHTKAVAVVEATKESLSLYVKPVKKDPSSPPPAPPASNDGGKEENTQETIELDSKIPPTSEERQTEDLESKELSADDQAKLDELSADAQKKQELTELLNGTDLPGLVQVAKKFPDLTPEKLAAMTDAKLRIVLLERLS